MSPVVAIVLGSISFSLSLARPAATEISIKFALRKRELLFLIRKAAGLIRPVLERAALPACICSQNDKVAVRSARPCLILIARAARVTSKAECRLPVCVHWTWWSMRLAQIPAASYARACNCDNKSAKLLLRFEKVLWCLRFPGRRKCIMSRKESAPGHAAHK